MEEGSIQLKATSAPDAQEAHIWIDIQSPNPVWSESVDLLSTTPEVEIKPSETGKISPGLTLLMVQSLVEVMQGRLEVIPVLAEEDDTRCAETDLTRIQCSMPLATPDAVEQGLAVD